jgi:tetratricopeptide (TPR) repeat protein
MLNKKKLTALTLAALTFLSQPPAIEARIMAGSVSEKKQTNKVTKLLNTARKHVSKGKNQDAIDTYWKVLEMDSHEPYAYLEMGELYKNLQIYDRSIEMLTSGLEIGENELDADTICHYYCVLTEVYSITSQQGLANKALIKAAEIAPRNPMPRKILGDIYLKNNRIANAFKAYKKALELDPYYHPATQALNELTMEYGNQLPKEDKDKDYIKKVAVKLEPASEKNNNQNSPIKEDKQSQPKIAKTTADNEVKPNIPIEETIKVANQDVVLSSNIQQTDNEEETGTTKAKKKEIKDERPLPLEAKELAKIESAKKKKSKKKKTSKPQTAEEIEKAISEREQTASIASDQSKKMTSKERDQHNIELFLAGNPTQKEEAINYFISQGETGLYQIEELLYDSNPDVRLLAVRALPLFEDYKEEVKTILQDELEDNNPSIAEEIQKALNLL